MLVLDRGDRGEPAPLPRHDNSSQDPTPRHWMCHSIWIYENAPAWESEDKHFMFMILCHHLHEKERKTWTAEAIIYGWQAHFCPGSWQENTLPVQMACRGRASHPVGSSIQVRREADVEYILYARDSAHQFGIECIPQITRWSWSFRSGLSRTGSFVGDMISRWRNL